MAITAGWKNHIEGLAGQRPGVDRVLPLTRAQRQHLFGSAASLKPVKTTSQTPPPTPAWKTENLAHSRNRPATAGRAVPWSLSLRR